ncbi:protein MIS12 [Sesamum alatum]|uniref:Protein MIS12 n=1 Tax=Sesamum alatum TaxID=300844 RepID=A0AAE1YBC8_9LAMI|nr:protein MIS12 [Sesamum alatum]
MEGSNSEAIFESLSLNPQLFINEVLNVVDDLLDEAFNFFLQEGSTLLKVEGTNRSADLSKGVAYIRDLVQLALDQRMEKWEQYCLRFCFRVPEGFALPKANEMPGDDLPNIDALTEMELDAELNSLRDKLTSIGKESAELDRECRTLERQSLSSNQSAGSIDEALQLYKENDVHQMFQELTTVASEFRVKLANLKRRQMEEIQCDRADRLRVRHGDVLNTPRGNGLFGARLEELQDFLEGILR